MLLSIKIDPILKEKGHKRYAFMSYSTGCIEIILALLAEVIIFYMQILIVEVRVFSLK